MTAVMKTHLPAFVVIIPVFVAVTLPTLARRLKWVETLVVGVQVLGIGGAISLALLFFRRGMPLVYQMGGWPAPWGIELMAGSLTVLFILIVAGVGLPVHLYALGNLSAEVGGPQRSTRFYVFSLLLGGTLAGMALTNDLFNIYVLVEVATLSCCSLVSARKHPRAAEAAFKYLILATLGSALILGGIGLIYVTTGHLNIGYASVELGRVWQHYPHVVWVAMSLMLVGFGVKSALFPLHSWLPDAHSLAPTPASALLSGLAVKGYLLCLIKILFNVFGVSLLTQFSMDRVLVLLGMIAIIAASLYALKTDELKRRLAFSTVAQIGYIFLGLGLMNPRGLTGAFFHLTSHAVTKAALFLVAGAVISATGRNRISELAGVGRKLPLVMGVFTVACLGLVGIPLFSGFMGKWYLLLGSLETGNVLAAAVLIAGSVLCAAYLFPIIRVAYFAPAPAETSMGLGLPQKLALILLGAGVLLLGLFPGPCLELAKGVAHELLAIH
ncbi:MAG TPA: hypothetical protein GXX57_07310 [Firmicutes bacterium]|nr:hypothetical protein [Bacillota bacterium]